MRTLMHLFNSFRDPLRVRIRGIIWGSSYTDVTVPLAQAFELARGFGSHLTKETACCQTLIVFVSFLIGV